MVRYLHRSVRRMSISDGFEKHFLKLALMLPKHINKNSFQPVYFGLLFRVIVQFTFAFLVTKATKFIRQKIDK